ncbi:MAG: transcriptional regulator [Thauera sp.]|jgi:predicted transcriptional regulator|nr:transcriptional regulator [Thauera sp.]
MNAKIMTVGIISRENYRQRTIAIARGEYKPRADEPKVWFESVASMAQVLSSDNQELLRAIINNNPGSLAELEQITSRNKSNLSRTLKTLEKYGIVSLRKEGGKLIPEVNATDFNVQFGLNYSDPIRAGALVAH